MSGFKGRHFEGEIVLWAVRWYCRYGISYRDLEQMMGERGVNVDHSTIYRWVQRYAPEIEKRLRWQWRRPASTSWRVDETYIKVRGAWTYLYRAVDKDGNTIDFYLSPTRNTKAAKRFLGKALGGFASGSGLAFDDKHRPGRIQRDHKGGRVGLAGVAPRPKGTQRPTLASDSPQHPQRPLGRVGPQHQSLGRGQSHTGIGAEQATGRSPVR